MRKTILTYMIIGIFLLTFLSINVNAFLNVKSVDAVKKEISVNTWLDIPFISKEVAKYKLEYNTDTCLTNCKASGIAYLYDPGQLFSDMKFLNQKGAEVLKNYKIKVLITKDVVVDQNEYKEVCEDLIGKNSTPYKKCSQEAVGTTKVTKSVSEWVDYAGEELQPGTYSWEISATKLPMESIDWIGSAYGVALDNWAWWSAAWNFKKKITATETQGVTWLNFTQENLSVVKNANMNADCSDFRFIDSTETYELGYNVTDCNAGAANVTVKIPTLTASTTTDFYFYYGNAGASGTGSKENAYMFYDDFNTNLNNWDSFIGSTGSTGVSGDGYALINSTGGTNVGIRTKINMTNEAGGATLTEIYGKFWNGGSAYFMAGTADKWGATTDYDTGEGKNAEVMFYQYITPTWRLNTFVAGSYSNADGTNTNPPTSYRIFGIMNNGTGGQSWSDGSSIQTRNYALTADRGIVILSRLTGDIKVDWVKMKRYATSQPTYSFGSEESAAYKELILNYPLEANKSTSVVMPFNCTSLTDPATTVTNISLFIDNNINFTLAGTTNFTNLWKSLTLAEGRHNWSCNFYNSLSMLTTSETRNFTIDIATPSVTPSAPVNNSEVITFTSPVNTQFNFTVFDALGLNNCWYYNGTGDTTITCGDNVTISLDPGTTTIVYYANDTYGNTASNATTAFLNLITPSFSYLTSLIEGQNDRFLFNITATRLTQSNASLTWNNTIYPMTSIYSNGTNSAFYKLFNPLVDVDTQFNFTVNYTVNNLIYNNSLASQIVYNTPPLNVSVNCSNAAYRFYLIDEKNLTSLDGDFEYNFFYGTAANNTLQRTYGKIANNNTFAVCINSSISTLWNLGEGEIFYRSPGYVDRRYYLFSDTNLTNITTTIYLHDLPTSDQTSFKLEITDTSLTPYIDKYSTLVRWYPDLNEYRVVDMGKTDETGSSVIHVKTEDVDYRIGVYERNGTLLKLADPIRMVCLLSPCTYTLKISPGDIDYVSFLGIQYTFNFNETTGMWTFTYSDPSLKTNIMNLTIWKDTGVSSVQICTSSVSGATGAITCNTSGYTGTLRGEVTRSASPPVIIAQKIVGLISSAFKSSWGLWLSLLLAIPIMFVLVMISPIAAIVGGIISLIPALYFGSINIGIFGGFVIMGGIVAHFLKRVS